MKTVTILTPTYNRCLLIKRLYDSLVNQSNYDFEWVVIDDGSTDQTEILFSKLVKESRFKIFYKKKENGGKHRALNFGYQFVSSPLTFIVDSDDYLTFDAIEIIKKKYIQYQNESDLCGFSFLRGTSDGRLLSDSGVPQDGMKASYVECRINGKIGGDMAEVWYTECLKHNPFPEIEGEKFLGEDVVWIRLSENYKLRFFNDIIYKSDYLEDGLTLNRRKHNIKSPKGCMIRAESFLESNVNFCSKMKAIVQYHIYGRFSGESFFQLFSESKHKYMYIFTVIPAEMLYLRWKKIMNKEL